MGVGARLLARSGLGVDPRPVEEPGRALGEVAAEVRKAGQHDLARLRPVIGAWRRRLDGGVAVPVVQGRLAHGLGFQRVIAVRDARIGFGHGLGHGVDALAVDLVAQVAAVGGTLEAAPLVFQRLVGGDGVHDHGHGLGLVGEGFRQPLGGGGALGGVGVAETVQGFGQGQALAVGVSAQSGQGLVEQTRPLGLNGAALGDEGFQFGRQFMRLHRPHPAQPG
ncbi:hypothetical protein D3C80_1373710 [compost metagenome]